MIRCNGARKSKKETEREILKKDGKFASVNISTPVSIHLVEKRVKPVEGDYCYVSVCVTRSRIPIQKIVEAKKLVEVQLPVPVVIGDGDDSFYLLIGEFVAEFRKNFLQFRSLRVNDGDVESVLSRRKTIHELCVENKVLLAGIERQEPDDAEANKSHVNCTRLVLIVHIEHSLEPGFLFGTKLALVIDTRVGSLKEFGNTGHLHYL